MKEGHDGAGNMIKLCFMQNVKSTALRSVMAPAAEKGYNGYRRMDGGVSKD